MKLLIAYIQGFFSRSGGYIFVSNVLARLLSFLASWLAIKLIPNKELGQVLFAWNIITFLMPFVGLGLHQSYLRYGALLQELEEKENLFRYVARYGILTSAVLSLLIMLVGWLVPFRMTGVSGYIVVLALVFIPMFLYELIRLKAMLHHQNKRIAYLEISYNLLLVSLVFGLSYSYHEKGYVLALLMAPALTVLMYCKSFFTNLFKVPKLSVTDKAFWKYGFFGSLANVATILLFAIDIFLIGHILKEPEQVTAYRYVSLIPFSLLFLPRVFMTTDFVTITERIGDKKYLNNYIRSYLMLFTGVSLGYILFSYWLAEEILSFFDASYVQYIDCFLVLNIGIGGILIFRGLFGNLLSSIGHIQINYYIAMSALILNIVSNSYLIPHFGITGAAITSACLMWFTGLATAFVFFYYYRQDKILKV